MHIDLHSQSFGAPPRRGDVFLWDYRLGVISPIMQPSLDAPVISDRRPTGERLAVEDRDEPLSLATAGVATAKRNDDKGRATD